MDMLHSNVEVMLGNYPKLQIAVHRTDLLHLATILASDESKSLGRDSRRS